MCGISFIWDRRSKINDDPVKEMMKALVHRGPDAQNFTSHLVNQGTFFLGSTRLKIVENSNDANQPLYSSDQKSVLLFNGEIYNFFDLKNELLQYGINFRTNSDTEVLLYWVKIFGADRICDLEGMFAFVFIDLEKNELLFARDRFGMKPLFYFRNNDFLIISSETRPIVSSGLVQKMLNDKQVAHYFNFRYANPPETFYENIYCVPIGHYVSVKDGEISKPIQYFKPDYDNQKIEVNEFRSLLFESIHNHCVASKGIGILLSGGVDSALLLALSHESGINLPCFSVFTDESKQERQLAESLSKSRMVDHRILHIDSESLADFESYIDKMDQPICDSAGFLTYLISDYTSQDVGVLLSGAGADELFGGYNRHYAYYSYLKWKKYLLKFKETFWPVFKNILPEHVNDFFRGIDPDDEKTFVNFIRTHFATLAGQYPIERKLVHRSNNPILNMLVDDRYNYLPSDVLAISDMMSMAAGVEMRMPFLDNKLFEMVNKCDPKYLLENGRKWILKDILSPYANPRFLKQKKKGFGMPINEWLKNEKATYLWDLFNRKNSYIFKFVEQDFFKSLLRSHQQGKENHSQEIWSVLTLAHWLEKEFNG